MAFRDGDTGNLPPFAPHEFDRAVSVYGAPFFYYGSQEEDERQFALLLDRLLGLVKPGGYISFAYTTPQWTRVEERRPEWVPNTTYVGVFEPVGPRYGFTSRNVLIEQDYGSLDEALATYGFIYGERAIDYLLERQTWRIPLNLQIWHRHV